MDVFANHRAYWKTGISVILMLAASVPASAQSDQQKTRVFTLEEAVDFALKNYPAVRVSRERLRRAETFERNAHCRVVLKRKIHRFFERNHSCLLLVRLR